MRMLTKAVTAFNMWNVTCVKRVDDVENAHCARRCCPHQSFCCTLRGIPICTCGETDSAQNVGVELHADFWARATETKGASRRPVVFAFVKHQ